MLKSGEYVRISKGPLAGLEGVLTRTKGNYRLVLSVEVLQKGIAVEVDLAMVEAAERVHNRSAVISG
jgi:transcription antitermination factor NusG